MRYEAHLKPYSIRSYWLAFGWLLVIQIIILLTATFASLMNPLLQFDRAAIYDGEIWRLWTGHFVHLGLFHALINVVGLFLIFSIFPAVLDNKNLPKSILFIAVCISVALLFCSPDLEWYLGFSGLLHGLFAFALVLHLTPKFSIYWLALIALIVKVIYEQLPGYDASYLINYIHAPVAVDAHLYGTLAGLIWGAFIKYRLAAQGVLQQTTRR